MENRRRDIFKIDVHRASYAKHLRSKKHSEEIRQCNINLPEWFFQGEQKPIKKQIKKIYKILKH